MMNFWQSSFWETPWSWMGCWSPYALPRRNVGLRKGLTAASNCCRKVWSLARHHAPEGFLSWLGIV